MNIDDAIYDEARVASYGLPELLRFNNRQVVQTVADWQKRRQEILELFSEYVYGFTPPQKLKPSYVLLEASDNALQGQAKRKQIQVTLERLGKSISFTLLLYVPKLAKPSPCMLGLNFQGNHSIHTDEQILKKEKLESARGAVSSRWPLDFILQQGYAVATIHCEDLMPDKPEGFKDSVNELFLDSTATWGAVGMWAYTLSQALTYFETDADINAEQVIAFGHSRLGKAALWSAAQDERFAAVISNNSGCMGAALSRRCFGERVHHINGRFPHWFCEKFKAFDFTEDALPIDQHMLLALLAPRPLYVASAQEDLWADPKGEFFSAKHASEIYELLGLSNLFEAEMPDAHNPIIKTVSYHLREGKHDVTLYDWQQYLAFANSFVR